MQLQQVANGDAIAASLRVNGGGPRSGGYDRGEGWGGDRSEVGYVGKTAQGRHALTNQEGDAGGEGARKHVARSTATVYIDVFGPNLGEDFA